MTHKIYQVIFRKKTDSKDFVGENIFHLIIGGPTVSFEGFNFLNSSLRMVSFNGAPLKGANLQGAFLENVHGLSFEDLCDLSTVIEGSECSEINDDFRLKEKINDAKSIQKGKHRLTKVQLQARDTTSASKIAMWKKIDKEQKLSFLAAIRTLKLSRGEGLFTYADSLANDFSGQSFKRSIEDFYNTLILNLGRLTPEMAEEFYPLLNKVLGTSKVFRDQLQKRSKQPKSGIGGTIEDITSETLKNNFELAKEVIEEYLQYERGGYMRPTDAWEDECVLIVFCRLNREEQYRIWRFDFYGRLECIFSNSQEGFEAKDLLFRNYLWIESIKKISTPRMGSMSSGYATPGNSGANSPPQTSLLSKSPAQGSRDQSTKEPPNSLLAKKYKVAQPKLKPLLQEESMMKRVTSGSRTAGVADVGLSHSLALLTLPDSPNREIGLLGEDWRTYPLISAIQSKDDKTAVSIIQQGQDVLIHAIDSKQNTGLHVAALYSRMNILKAYGRGNLMHNNRNAYGITPFQMAIISGNPESVEYMLANQADWTLSLEIFLDAEVPPLKLTALGLAIYLGHTEIVQILYRYLADRQKLSSLVTQSSVGNSLHVGIISRSGGMLTFLLTELLDWTRPFLEQPNLEGLLPLAYAAQLGHELAVEQLIIKGAQADSSGNPHRRTALHYAVLAQKPKVVKMLLRCRASESLLSQEPVEGNADRQMLPIQLAEGLMRLEVPGSPKHALLQTIVQYLSNVHAFRATGSHGFAQPEQVRYENLILPGGGAKGVAFVGALQALSSKGVLPGIKRVVGTSAGAITALLVSLNFSLEELEKAMEDLTLNSLLGDRAKLFNRAKEAKESLTAFLNQLKKDFSGESSRLSQAAGMVTGTLRAAFGSLYYAPQAWELFRIISMIGNEHGLSEGKELNQWLKRLVEAKLTKDFGDHRKKYGEEFIKNLTYGRLNELVEKGGLGYRHLHVYLTDVSHETILNPNSEVNLEMWKGTSVVDTICASAALPGVFQPRAITYFSKADVYLPKTSMCIDGGLLRNCPIDHFDDLFYQDPHVNPLFRLQRRTNQTTLGLALECVGPSLENKIDQINGQLTANPNLKLTELISSILDIFYQAERQLQALRGDIQNRMITINTYPVGTIEFEVVENREGFQAVVSKARQVVQDSPLLAEYNEEAAEASAGMTPG